MANGAKVEAEKNHALRQDHLEKSRLIASFEEHRASLKDGEECPLCGSTEHPFVTETNEPTALNILEDELRKAKQTLKEKEDDCRAAEKSLTELISRQGQLTEAARNAEKEIFKSQTQIQQLASAHHIAAMDVEGLNAAKKTQEETIAKSNLHLAEIDQAGVALNESEKEQSATAHQVELTTEKMRAQKDAWDRLHEEQQKQEKELAVLQNTMQESCRLLLESLQPYQIAAPEAGQENECQKELTDRNTKYQQQLRLLNDTTAALEKINVQLEKSEQELAKYQQKATAFAEQKETHQAAAKDTNPSECRKLRGSWKNLDDTETVLNRLQNAVTQTKTAHTECSKAVERAAAKLKSLTESLTERLQPSRFATINELLTSQVDKDTAEKLEDLEKFLQSQADQLAGELKKCQNDIENLRKGQIVEGDAIAALEAECSQVEKNVKELSEAIGGLKKELESDDANKQKHAAKLLEIEEADRKLQVWRQLQDLIGSHDGSKFRKYAQGISLEVLVSHANVHLRRLSKRYFLQRRKGEDLELEILDRDQADATRPMASLSGGESFITSLALALGLANMAGRNTRIDSLFIDEGFGSLDDDTLDIAISALETLRRDNKTIGVISHVDLLKERIAVQIAVKKKSGGVSILEVTPPSALA